MLVFSVIWINSTDTIGGRSIAFFDKNGRLIAVKIITNKWTTEDKIMLLFTFFIYLSLYGSDINATFVNPDPERSPIISKTLP